MEDNPFAPGQHAAGMGGDILLEPLEVVALESVRRELATHTSGMGVASDRRVAGPRIRLLTVGLTVVGLGLFVAGLLTLVSFVDDDGIAVLSGLTLTLGFVLGLIGAGLLFRVFQLVDRTAAHPADKAALAFWRAVTFRPAFSWSMLSPSARASNVEAPFLGDVVTAEGAESLGDYKAFRKWLAMFAMPGHSQQRAIRPTQSRVVREEGDLAVTRTTLKAWSMPRWAVITIVVAFVLVRLVGILLGIAFWFTIRKSATVEIEQRWLKATDGAWYLAEASTQRAS